MIDHIDVNLRFVIHTIDPEDVKKGRVQPPREFLMRFIRWVASGEEEIDKIITNAIRNWPPPVRYAKRLKCHKN